MGFHDWHLHGQPAYSWGSCTALVCNPALVGQIDATFQLLQNNTDTAPAGNCGAPPDGQGNYTFGYGYLNVLKAGIAGCAPTEVSLYDFTATTLREGIRLSWQTSQEIDLVGFNIYLSRYIGQSSGKINQELIPAINPGQRQGNAYRFVDTTAEAGKTDFYWVEWVGNRGCESFGTGSASLAPYAVWLPLSLSK